MQNLYDIPVQAIDGQQTTLAPYRGKALLVVNVASKCGLTPQYDGLEKAFRAYRDRGLVVLGFPCNDFAGQEPGSEAEIQSFCTTSFDVSFPLMGKVQINSGTRHPLYAALIEAQPTRQADAASDFPKKLAGYGFTPKNETDVLWNFEKFLVGRDGRVLGRFAPDMAPDHPTLVKAIEAALG